MIHYTQYKKKSGFFVPSMTRFAVSVANFGNVIEIFRMPFWKIELGTLEFL